MKIRLEGTKDEMINFILSLYKTDRKTREISSFYPNRVNSTALLNGLIDKENPVGRIYVELD
jgi:hypothetical protein